MNKRVFTALLIATLCSVLVVGCTAQPVDQNQAQPSMTVQEAFTKAAELFVSADSGQSAPTTVILYNIQQTGSVLSAVVDIEQQLVATTDTQAKIAQDWLEQNKQYLEQWQIYNIQTWINERLSKPQNTATGTVHWTYKLMSTSTADALAGNFAVWYWTNIDKVPVGYITNWEPVVLVHWGGFSPEDVYKQIFELVRINH